ESSVELDAFRLHAALGKVAAGDLRILGRDPKMAPALGILPAGELLPLGDGQMAASHLEVERRGELRINEFHQHVVAADREMGGAEGEKGRHVEGADADDGDRGMVGAEAELA